MIERLKYLIDACEHNQKFKEVLLMVASLPENKQKETLRLIELICGVKL